MKEGGWVDAKAKHGALRVIAGHMRKKNYGASVAVVDWAMQYTRKKPAKPSARLSARYNREMTEAELKALQAELDKEFKLADEKWCVEQEPRAQISNLYNKWLNQNASIEGDKGHDFLEAAGKRLIEGGASPGIAEVLRSGTYQEFWNALSDSQRQQLREAGKSRPDLLPSPEQPKEVRANNVRGLHTSPIREIYSDRTHRFARDFGADDALIDQKLYWLDTHSPATWEQVTRRGGRYKQFEYCKESLERFLDDEIWKKFVRGKQFGGIIMLGGGSGEKDKVICNSLLELLPPDREDAVHYSIVDVSIYMLMNSVLKIEEDLDKADAHDRIAVRPLIWDFLKLRHAIERLRHRGSNVAWFILNNTFGNLNRAEKKLFDCIREVAEPGDILVIGTETWSGDAGDAKDEGAELKSNYEGKEVDRFLETPLRAVADQLKISHSQLHDLIACRATSVVPEEWGTPNDYSQIARTITIEISIERESKQKLVLLISSRYVVNELLREARRYGFQHLIDVSHNENEKYKQIVFRFEGRDALISDVVQAEPIGNAEERDA